MPNESSPQKALKPKQATQPLTKLAPHTAQMPSFDELPDTAWVRQAQLVRDPKHPTRPTPLPFSPATFWRLIASQKFPKPTKLSARVTAWKVGDVRAWINEQSAAA